MGFTPMNRFLRTRIQFFKKNSMRAYKTPPILLLFLTGGKKMALELIQWPRREMKIWGAENKIGHCILISWCHGSSSTQEEDATTSSAAVSFSMLTASIWWSRKKLFDCSLWRHCYQWNLYRQVMNKICKISRINQTICLAKRFEVVCKVKIESDSWAQLFKARLT